MSANERQHGVVNWFDEEKGYGFITANWGDIFVHRSGIRKDNPQVRPVLNPGQEVEFGTGPGRKDSRITAIDVVVIG